MSYLFPEERNRRGIRKIRKVRENLEYARDNT